MNDKIEFKITNCQLIRTDKSKSESLHFDQMVTVKINNLHSELGQNFQSRNYTCNLFS